MQARVVGKPGNDTLLNNQTALIQCLKLGQTGLYCYASFFGFLLLIYSIFTPFSKSSRTTHTQTILLCILILFSILGPKLARSPLINICRPLHSRFAATVDNTFTCTVSLFKKLVLFWACLVHEVQTTRHTCRLIGWGTYGASALQCTSVLRIYLCTGSGKIV